MTPKSTEQDRVSWVGRRREEEEEEEERYFRRAFFDVLKKEKENEEKNMNEKKSRRSSCGIRIERKKSAFLYFDTSPITHLLFQLWFIWIVYTLVSSITLTF